MDPGELLSQLVDLADEVDLEVRRAGRGPTGEGEPPVASGVCRVRGRVWVVLSAGDTVEERIRVLAGALRSHAGEQLEARWLPPAVRACLGP